MELTGRRLIAILCALCMLFTSMPVSVYADPDVAIEQSTEQTPASPTDLDPVQEEEQDIPAEEETGEDSEETEEPDETEPEENEETEEPAKDLPYADQEVSGYDDITVTGSLEGEKPEDYLIRFTPTYSQTLYLILTADGEMEADVTDENTGTVKKFIPDETDQNLLTLPYYKVKNDSTYLIRLSAKAPASFSLRMVKTSILKAEEESANTTGEEPAEVPDEPQPETEPQTEPESESQTKQGTEPETEPESETELQSESQTESETEPQTAPEVEPETEPEAEPETEPQVESEAAVQPEEPVSDPTPGTTEPESKPVEQASPVIQIIPESEEQDVPATQTDLEAEPVQEEPVEIRIEANDSPVKADIVFMSDAGIPQDTELQVRELTEEEQAAYQARTVRALKCEDETYLYYTKYLAFTLLHNGEPVELNAPAIISVTLTDVSEGIDALQVVRFGGVGAKLLESERTGDTISFRTSSLAVFGIGNALTPLDTQETELVSVEVLSFSPDAEVSLKETKAPEVEEGLEVLGTFRVEDQTKAAGAEETDGLWIKAELNEDAELAPMESVSLYRVEDGQAEILVEDLSQNSDITELDAEHVAVIKDTGYRHLTLTVNPDETTNDQIVTLDGMMPKEAEATVTEVTERYADYAFETKMPETESESEASQTGDAELTDEGGKRTEVFSDQDSSGNRTTLAAYDISISHSEGEYQPDEDRPISVEIVDSRITTDGNIELWHIKDDGTKEQVTDFTLEEGRIAFEATGFSVYMVISHEDGTVVNPRVMFHFISDGAAEETDGTNAYYIGNPYTFKNEDGNVQSTQILANSEALELIADPDNQQTKYFYGWYVVNPFPVSGTTDEFGIGTADSSLYYTWPAAPESISFNHTISIADTNVQIGDPVNWSLGNVSGTGNVDRDGNVHVFLAPVFEKYNFVNFMLYPWQSGATNSSNVMTRKLIALGSSTSVDVKISDVRSTSSDPVHLLFIGWQYNAGTEQNPDWRDYQTVDYTGAELTDPGKDGVYLNIDLEDKSSVDLYPIFVEARWVDYNPGKSGNGAVYVPSTFRESWGSDPQNPPAGMTNDSERNVFTHMIPSSREGYVFGGWYAFAATDPDTGDFTNLEEGVDVQACYITSANEGYQPYEVTLSGQRAIQITDGTGAVVYNGSFSVNGYTLFSGDGSTLKLYDSIDRLTLYARWIPDGTKITVIYWTENVEDNNYTASAAKEVFTADLSTGLGKDIASGSTITLEDLKAYTDVNYHVGIVSRDILDDVGAVPMLPVQDPSSNERIEAREEIFFDLKDSLSDTSKVIDGQGNTTFNVYFSRKVFKLVFHIGRDGYVKNAGRQKAANDNWLEYMYKDSRVTEVLGREGQGNPSYTGVAHMTYDGETYDSSYVTDIYNIKKDYVPRPDIVLNDQNLYIIEAKYGAYIGDRWPSPVNPAFGFDTITAPEDNKVKTPYIWTAYYDSLYYRNSTKRDALGNTSNNNPDINGIHNYMSGELCADQTGTHIINDNQVHHLVCYFGEASNNNRYKQYHILKEAVEGVKLPEGTEANPGTNYSAYLPTAWSLKYAATSVILPHSYYELSDESPTPVISNQQPQHQLGPELEGYTQVYSCYDPQTRPSSTVSGRNESHIYFFYTPKQYKLKFMYEDEAVDKDYYYGASLADALDGCEEPEKEGYYFKGWYTNEAGEGEPFDFEHTTMPAESIMLYPVMKPLQYTVKIDPNGGVIDHRINASQSTYFTANYGTTVGEYYIKREFIKLTDKEQNPQDPTYYSGTKYYYVNTQFLGESHEGEWGYPTDVRNAVYVAENEFDAYYDFYCSAIDNADPTYWTGIEKLSRWEFIDKYTSYPYRRMQAGSEHYSFMGWYQVYSDGSIASMPFNFNDPVTGPLTLRAMWRLDGGYYIQYNPYFFHEDGEGHVTVIVGEMDEWQDPDPNLQLYADQAPTHILRAPTNPTQGWVFRGWRVVKATGTSTYTPAGGDPVSFTTWEPIDDQNVIYYQPGENFIIDSTLVSQITDLGSVIHMQAYYEPEEESERRPLITNLILDSNDEYGYGYINTTESDSLPPLSGPGVSGINTRDKLYEGKPTQILFGDFENDNLQSNMALHLYRYATTKTFNGVAGTNFFQTDDPYMLIGFDENADPEHPTTGSAYVPAYSPDSVIAVTRDDNVTLYAMWEPMIYVTLVNDTDEQIEVVLDGHGTDLIRIVNAVTGEYDREESSNRIPVPAHDEVKIVLPVANTSSDTITATALNNHYRKRMSVRGELDMGPGQARVPDGTGCEDIPYGYDTTFTEGTLRLSPYSLVITYTEEPDMSVDFDVNGGTWQETSPDYVLSDAGLYTIDSENITDNQYRPADPGHPEAGVAFIGWTTNPDIAAHTDFTGTHSVTWGDTVIDIKDYATLLDAVINDYLWDFSEEPPYEQVLYAVYSNVVTVTFDLRRRNNEFHNWTGPETTDRDGMHVFYRSSPTSRYVTYKLMPGETVPQPSDPTASESDWFFIAWLTKSGYENKTDTPNNIGKTNFYDFSKAVSRDFTLYTSWFKSVPQHYTFTVENHVEGGNENDEFTYTITVSDAMVWGKNGNNQSGNRPSETDWGSVSVDLKNNQQYTVLVTVKYFITGSDDKAWDACCVEIDVIDQNGNSIKKNILVTYAPGNSAPRFVGGYNYNLSITQEPKAGFDSTISVQDVVNTVYSTDPDTLTYQFSSKWGSSREKNKDFDKNLFPPNPENQVNGFEAGEENSLTIVFTNTGSAIVAPTDFRNRPVPYVLMLAAGMILMVLLGSPALRRRREKENAGEGGPSFNAENTDTGPTERGKSRAAPVRGPDVPVQNRRFRKQTGVRAQGSPEARGDPGENPRRH